MTSYTFSHLIPEFGHEVTVHCKIPLWHSYKNHVLAVAPHEAFAEPLWTRQQMQGALPWVPTPAHGRCHESITKCCGQAMARSSIIADNVPPCIQLGIDTSTKSLGLTTIDVCSFSCQVINVHIQCNFKPSNPCISGTYLSERKITKGANKPWVCPDALNSSIGPASLYHQYSGNSCNQQSSSSRLTFIDECYLLVYWWTKFIHKMCLAQNLVDSANFEISPISTVSNSCSTCHFKNSQWPLRLPSIYHVSRSVEITSLHLCSKVDAQLNYINYGK
jgi:hypothetical protein